MPLRELFQRLRGQPLASASTCTSATPVGLPAAGRVASTPRLDQLDLQSAVIHHLEWCVQFNDHLGLVNQSETPPPRRLPGAQSSELGQWLQRAALRAPGAHPLFADLTREHRRFHELADEALELACEGRMDLASTLLNTDFERSRGKVLNLLRAMQKG